MSQFYQKINTLWKRDNKNCIVMGDFSLPEFEYLRDVQWLAEEKIDGTNMSWGAFEPLPDLPEPGFVPRRIPVLPWFLQT